MLGTVVLILATIAAGLTAGAFFPYANAIMPGLRRVDDRTFVGAFQAIDRAIITPVFIGGCFLGTLVLAAAAALLHLGDPVVLGRRPEPDSCVLPCTRAQQPCAQGMSRADASCDDDSIPFDGE